MMHVDKLMGGRVRDKDAAVVIGSGAGDELKQYIQSLFDSATFNWSQIQGDVTGNQEFINFLNSLIDLINQNNMVAGDLITNELKAYVSNLVDNLTITWEQITGNPQFNEAFQTYIDNLLQDLTITWEQITGSPVINQAFADYITSLKQDILNSLDEFIIDESVTNSLKTYIDNLLTDVRTQLTEVTNATTLNNTLLTEIQEQIAEINNLIEYIQEGATITQDYKDYIENKFTALQQAITNITEGAVITEEIKKYIDDSLNEIKNYLQQFIDNSIGEAITNIKNEINTITGEATRLISGTIEWIENLDFQVSPLVYQILNQRQESAAKLITIPANVSDDPMFAVIYADLSGNVGYLLGVPAPAPSVPQVNDNTQIHLLTMYIPAHGTAPGVDPNGETTEIATEVIYDEAIEWTTAKVEEAGVSIALEAITAPAKGVKHILVSFAGGLMPASKSDLLTAAAGSEFFTRLDADLEAESELDFSTSELFADHKTDFTTAGIRHIIYYRVLRRTGIVAKLIDLGTGNEYRLRATANTTEVFNIGEIGFSAEISDVITFQAHLIDIPAGDYKLVISGFQRNDQQYTVTAASNVIPATAAISLTRAEAISAVGGNIALSLRTSVAWGNNSGILFDLYNYTKKIGTIAMLPGKLYGFNPENTADYQRITLPFADFNPLSDEITKLVIRPVNAWINGTALYIDNVTLQTGGNLIKETDKYVKFVNFDSEHRILTIRRSFDLEEITVTIPDTAQSQSDWTQANAAAKDFIKNKPAIPAGQIQSDWNQAGAGATDFIKNKPTLGTISSKAFWTGTAAAYAAIGVKDANTIYFIEE